MIKTQKASSKKLKKGLFQIFDALAYSIQHSTIITKQVKN